MFKTFIIVISSSVPEVPVMIGDYIRSCYDWNGSPAKNSIIITHTGTSGLIANDISAHFKQDFQMTIAEITDDITNKI